VRGVRRRAPRGQEEIERMTAFAVIPARGGSKGLPRKHLLPLHGKPVLAYTVEAARAARSVSRVIVSTDDREISDLARTLGAEVVDRPSRLATDTAAFDDVLRHAVRWLEEREGLAPDVVVALQANVPIREPGTIDRAVARLAETGAETVATAHAVRERPEWIKRLEPPDRLVPFQEPGPGYRRQDLPPLYLVDGAVIAIRTETLLATDGDRRVHAYMGRDVRLLEHDAVFGADIDTASDLRQIEALMTVLERRGRGPA
jgi:CMP-N-acetylneuraminic acid synthetase